MERSMKIWEITRRLLYQNRWLYLLLMLWPFGMAAILLVSSGKPAKISRNCSRKTSKLR